MKQPTSLSSPQEGTCTCKGPKKTSRSSKARTCVRHIDVLNCKDSVTKEVRRNKKNTWAFVAAPTSAASAWLASFKAQTPKQYVAWCIWAFGAASSAVDSTELPQTPWLRHSRCEDNTHLMPTKTFSKTKQNGPSAKPISTMQAWGTSTSAVFSEPLKASCPDVKTAHWKRCDDDDVQACGTFASAVFSGMLESACIPDMKTVHWKQTFTRPKAINAHGPSKLYTASTASTPKPIRTMQAWGTSTSPVFSEPLKASCPDVKTAHWKRCDDDDVQACGTFASAVFSGMLESACIPDMKTVHWKQTFTRPKAINAHGPSKL